MDSSDSFRIGVISGKLGDVDGVSLEVDKWNSILIKSGHQVFTIAGRYASPLPGVPTERQLVCEEIQFGSPEQLYYEKLVFPYMHKNPPHISEQKRIEIADTLEVEGKQVADRLFELVQEHELDVLVGQNTNAMPMTLLGGVGIYKLATERRGAAIFYHHDFWWERSRFSHNHIEPLLARIMPPTDPGVEHVVLSTYAAHILSSLKRVQPAVIPNCEDFDNPVARDEYNSDLRFQLGFHEDDILVVQPTRIVPRKRIEDSAALVGKLIERTPRFADRVRFIISLYQGDEPDEDYIVQIREQANSLGFDIDIISDRVASQRGTDGEGRKIFTNRDVLAHADLVTYLPLWEGFGNAFLEAVAARVPIVVSTYLVYKTDIKIMGFDSIEILDRYDQFGRLIIPDNVIDQIETLLGDSNARKKMVDRNFEIGKKHFGFQTLESMIRKLFSEYGDEIRASRRRIHKSKARYSV